jgi:hypothetical protein
MNKKIFVSIIFLACTFGCRIEQSTPCPDCIYPAIEITMMDTNGAKINGFTIKAISTTGDTLFTNDSLGHSAVESPYFLFGKSGTYKVEITSPKYEDILIDNVNVQGGRCGPNARILGIIAEKPKLAKKLNSPYVIALDSTGHGCGN